MKRFVAFARVSSREQEREGFSLAVQEEALKKFAAKAGGEVIKLFSVAETATKQHQRQSFRELLAFAQKHALELDGVLFYKIDRAARNLFDYVELERLESDYGLPFYSTSQPTENTPAGRMMRRTLATMAAFYTDQQSIDVRDGQARRVKDGHFACRAPYGYRNARIDGRGVILLEPTQAANVRHAFQVFAYKALTLDGLIEHLHTTGHFYSLNRPRFPRATLYSMLTDRSYLGEVLYQKQWHPGRHEPLVDRATWDRVQAILGGHIYRAHEMAFAGELVKCGHCGHPITGERKTKGEGRVYTYYRCAKYTAPGHPRIRVREADLEGQVLAMIRRLRVDDDEIREWMRCVIRDKAGASLQDAQDQRAELLRLQTLIAGKQKRLMDMRLDGEIDADAYAGKSTELRDQLADVKLQLEVLDRGGDETAELAIKVFELAQSLEKHWFSADAPTKRAILDLICLNYRLDGVTLVMQMNKAFELLSEGLILADNRGSGTRLELFIQACQPLRRAIEHLKSA